MVALVATTVFGGVACGNAKATDASAKSTSSAAPSATMAAPKTEARGAAGTVNVKVGDKATDYALDKAFVDDEGSKVIIHLLNNCPKATCKEATDFNALEAVCKDRKEVQVIVGGRADGAPLPTGKFGKETKPRGWMRLKNFTADEPDLFPPTTVDIASADKTKMSGKLVATIAVDAGRSEEIQKQGGAVTGDFVAEVCAD